MKKELVVAYRPKSSVSEALKIVHTNLEFSSIDGKVKSILVTSSIPGEGKSFISANLSVIYAQVGSKVLLVDCDMRRGRQHEVFEVTNDKGLSNLLIDNIKDSYNDYIKKTEIKNLSVLPRGTVPPNPSKLLSSDRMKNLVKVLADKYDIVIYDGVPTGGLVDSVIVADLVDKIVIVSSYKETPMEYLRNTKRALEKFKDKIAGVVLNKIPSKDSSYYDNYYSS